MAGKADTKNLKQSAGQAGPRVGVVGLAYPGFHLGEELAGGKVRQMVRTLAAQPVEIVPSGKMVETEAEAREVGRHLAGRVDCILAVITTFVPDTFIVELLDACPVPIFLWAVEREMQCIALVCGPLVTGTLFNLGRPYRLVAGDTDDAACLAGLLSFSRAAHLATRLRSLRVGYCGGRCPIMLGMEANQGLLKKQWGATVVELPIQEFYQLAEGIRADEAKKAWRQICQRVGEVTAAEADGLLSARYYLAARRLAENYSLDALSLNCFPQLKSKVCLAMALLNDDGIAAACEGDLHSTILMALLQTLSGRAAFNGDFLRMYSQENEVLFSHCGGGAFSLAPCASKVCLRESIETHDGLAVCYATHLEGPVTLVNLMTGPAGLRLSAMCGQGVATDLEYEGTPLRVRFERPVGDILQTISQTGAGHHWNGAAGDYVDVFATVCQWTGVRFQTMTNLD